MQPQHHEEPIMYDAHCPTKRGNYCTKTVHGQRKRALVGLSVFLPSLPRRFDGGRSHSPTTIHTPVRQGEQKLPPGDHISNRAIFFSSARGIERNLRILRLPKGLVSRNLSVILFAFDFERTKKHTQTHNKPIQSIDRKYAKRIIATASGGFLSICGASVLFSFLSWCTLWASGKWDEPCPWGERKMLHAIALLADKSPQYLPQRVVAPVGVVCKISQIMTVAW